MSEFIENPHLDALDRTINSTIASLAGYTEDEEEFDKITTQFVKLMKLREELTNKENDFHLKERDLELKADANVFKSDELDLKRDEFYLKKEELLSKPKISHETWAMIGANLAGILLVLNHERAGVVASKAFGMISKLAK